jgi:XRE family transcriptional regulator, regulator of sulfur utilization
MSDRMSTNLAANLRRLREARDLTQAELAQRSDVPRPTLAHLESGSANPTLSVLLRVADALRVPLEEIVAPPRAGAVFHPAGSLPSRTTGRVSVQEVLPEPISGTSIERLELPAGARFTAPANAAGTRQHLTCEAGELEVRTAEEVWRLSHGDLLVLRGDESHVLYNRGRGRAVVYSVVALVPLAR